MNRELSGKIVPITPTIRKIVPVALMIDLSTVPTNLMSAFLIDILYKCRGCSI